MKDSQPTNDYNKNVGADIKITLLIGRSIKAKEDVLIHPLLFFNKNIRDNTHSTYCYTSTILFQNLPLLFLINSSHGRWKGENE